MASRKTGDWDKAREIFETMVIKTQDASKRAILRDAHFLRGEMIKGIQAQAPGGSAFKPLSPLTLAARRLSGFRGTKALMVHGDLRNGTRVENLGKGRGAFIGILRTAKASDGKPLVNIAEVQEFGAGPIRIELTKKVMRYLAVLFRELHGEGAIPKPFWLIKAKSRGWAGAKQYIVTKIPPRPFIRPVFEMFATPEAVKKRIEECMAELLKGVLSK
jgi:hypothetical protein